MANVMNYASKIAKLLAMAEDPNISEEMAANYLAKASEWQLSMTISDADIRAAGGSKNVTEIFSSIKMLAMKNAPYIKARRELLTGLAFLYNCRPTLATDRSFMRIWGFESDLRFIEQMYTSIDLQLANHMAVEWREYIGNDPARSWKVSFAHGYVGRVVDRLRDARARQTRAATADSPGTALVLRDRGEMVEHHYKSATDGLVRGGSVYKNTSVNSRDGVVSGYRAGNRADIGNTRVGGNDRRQIDA
jgi:hypothetical protein